ncbi:hypothetical protein FI667_g12727, partial [Globisporangium splendens]
MGAEWNQITGQSHSTVPPQKAEQRFDALVYIPETRKVTEAQNQDLMAPITEKEVREAIATLHRHKAGGVDSLNNDFYKDSEDVMVDVLFAKVLATRLQDIFLWIIGEAQQGFVRDRLMENAILIMQAALDKAYYNSAEGLDDDPGIAMFDFMKAYDTLDRDFLFVVLCKSGFGR